MSFRALNVLAWGAAAPWGSGLAQRFGFPLLAAAAVLVWFLPTNLAGAAVGFLLLALLLAIPLFWREGYTWMVLWLAPIAAFDPLPTDGLRAAKYVLLAAAIVVALAKRRLSPAHLGRFDRGAAYWSLALLLWVWFRALFGQEPLAGALEASRLTLVAGLVYLWLSEPSRFGARGRHFALWMIMAAFQVTVCITEAAALGVLRSYGTFPNANAMGAYLVLTGVLCYAFALSTLKRLHRVALWSFLGAVLFALYLTGSRAAGLALVLSLLVTACAARHWKSLALGVAALLAVGVVYATSPVFRLLTDAALRFQTGLTHRPILWEAVDRASPERLWLGYGFEASGAVMAKEARYPSDIHREILAPMMSAGNPHNYYRELLLETGLVGVLLFGVALAAIVRSAWRSRRSADRHRRVYALAVLGITAGLLAHSYFERSLFLGSMSSAIFYWFLVAQTLRHDEPAPEAPVAVT